MSQRNDDRKYIMDSIENEQRNHFKNIEVDIHQNINKLKQTLEQLEKEIKNLPDDLEKMSEYIQFNPQDLQELKNFNQKQYNTLLRKILQFKELLIELTELTQLLQDSVDLLNQEVSKQLDSLTEKIQQLLGRQEFKFYERLQKEFEEIKQLVDKQKEQINAFGTTLYNYNQRLENLYQIVSDIKQRLDNVERFKEDIAKENLKLLSEQLDNLQQSQKERISIEKTQQEIKKVNLQGFWQWLQILFGSGSVIYLLVDKLLSK